MSPGLRIGFDDCRGTFADTRQLANQQSETTLKPPVEWLCLPELARYFWIFKVAKEFTDDLFQPLGLKSMRDPVPRGIESFSGTQHSALPQANRNHGAQDAKPLMKT
jgi:hypothetical protein